MISANKATEGSTDHMLCLLAYTIDTAWGFYTSKWLFKQLYVRPHIYNLYIILQLANPGEAPCGFYASSGSYYLSAEAKAPKTRCHQSHEAPSHDPILQ